MLKYICIKNLALLEELKLEFEPGFTAVTGETGAGKSVLLGACLLYTSPSPRDVEEARMPSSA